MARSRQHHRARTLSQNFLTDPATAARFVRAARPDRTGLLLEVGPGRGALTAALAPYCRELRTYEIDHGLVPPLRALFAATPHVRVYEGDFVAVDPPRERFAVVGNVPFSRTADIVGWCLRAPALTDATLITQLEYARKRTGDFGRWSLRTVETWPQFEWRLLGRIGRREFRPVPRVDAGILRVERRPRPLLPAAELAGYRRLVGLGFSGVGGSLYASLHRAGHARRQLDAAFDAARVDRAEIVAHVPPRAWLALYAGLRHD
ncbi:ErmE/ErmH/ErmO/ErmR family 23S rRNA (adenine(2058)-N(6))-methyltransferase [Streptomyces sp. NBC_01716]|uniref:ErmE/ErmH/ErmO/ErmR family 23S rRNA (adenine(2058)-N(6))-methyltransferase n=1 Tax=Streptomyces sp. NBC_01716 TaxID=2975917 RepID=UPI002E36C24D|nr:ErmE/ErmH/ErmO/ErmR family 23S rRNA (adenine(2058)-N(6))-methyltransferase [Streptomyces sp. NBC_01716]